MHADRPRPQRLRPKCVAGWCMTNGAPRHHPHLSRPLTRRGDQCQSLSQKCPPRVGPELPKTSAARGRLRQRATETSQPLGMSWQDARAGVIENVASQPPKLARHLETRAKNDLPGLKPLLTLLTRSPSIRVRGALQTPGRSQFANQSVWKLAADSREGCPI